MNPLTVISVIFSAAEKGLLGSDMEELASIFTDLGTEIGEAFEELFRGD